jgi:hypothetical protein
VKVALRGFALLALTVWFAVMVRLSDGTPVMAQGVWSLPADRAYDWKPGVTGGIPHRTNVCATVPAGASVSTVNAALNACPNEGVVQLSAGQYTVNNDSYVIPSGRTLRGMGPGVTRLVSPSGASLQTAPVRIGHLWPTFTGARNLTATAPRGSTTIQLANTSGLSVGEVVVIDQLIEPSVISWGSGCTGGDCRLWFTRPNRALGDMVKVVQVINATSIVIEPPLSLDYKTSNTAQLARFADNNGTPVALTSRAGVEDLSITNPNSVNEKGGVLFAWATESWARNVEVTNTKGDNVSFDGCFRCTVRDSSFRIPLSTNVVNGGAWYGLSFSHYASQNLFENNIVTGHNKVMVMRAAGPGNVIGYNYVDDGRISGNSWVETGLNPGHTAGTHFALFEGNWAFNGDPDNTWGGSIYNVYFRNHLTGKRTNGAYGGHSRAAGPMELNWQFSYVGNVLGLPGQPSSVYEQTSPNSPPGGWEGIAMFRIGFNADTWGAADPKVGQTLLREGNFDYVTNQVRWDTTPKTLPDTLYLDGKPSYFTGTWPWVDPQGSTKVYSLPAKLRAEGQAGPTPVPTVQPTATRTPTPVIPTSTPLPPTPIPPTPTRTPTPVPTVVPTTTPTPVPSPTPVPAGLASVCTQTSPRTTTTTATNSECAARNLGLGCLKLVTDRGTATCFVGVR